MGSSLKEVRNRIKSVITTQQMTKAMKMVAVAKLRRSQQAILQIRPYANKLDEMLVNILTNLEGDVEISYGKERPIKNALIVVMTSDRGLCGAFNTNIIKAAVALIEGKYQPAFEAGNLSMLFIGKKGYDYFRKRYNNIHFITDFVGSFLELDFEKASIIADSILVGFDSGRFDAVDVAFGEFKNPAVQNCISEQFLPVVKKENPSDRTTKNFKSDFIFEPDKDELLATLVPSILKTTLFRFMLDTNASEHGARMTAMDAATENAEELLKELRLSYNKARQEAITKEILEIVGGAAALDNA